MKLFNRFYVQLGGVILLCLLPSIPLLAEGASDFEVAIVEEQKKTDTVYKIGVLAYKGKAAALKRWLAHASYLNTRLAPLKFKIIPLSYKNDELTQAIIARKLDFVITNPGHYIELELGGYVSRLATRRILSSQGILDQFGGTAFVKAEIKHINRYADLVGKKILIPSKSSLGGWKVHLREALAEGIDLRTDSKIVELNSHKKVVLAILAGEADVGFVRSDLIEDLVVDGLISLEQIKVIDKKQIDDYPYLLSTQLYPEWPFAVVTGTSSSISIQVLHALLELSVDDEAARAAKIQGWTIPGHYSEVGELFREAGIGPYKPQPISLSSFFLQYLYQIIALLISFVFAIVSMLRMVNANNKLKKEIISRTHVEKALRKSEYDFRRLFEDAEISIWNEDMSAVYDSLLQLRQEGVSNLDEYFCANPSYVEKLISKVKVTGVNKATLKLFEVKEADALLNIEHSLGENALDTFIAEVCAIWNKEYSFTAGAKFRSILGRDIDAIISFSIPKTREDFKCVPVCILDISTTKQAEEKLKKSENNLALAQQISHLGSWELDHVTQQLTWSDEVYRIFEIDRLLFEPTYQMFVAIIHPDDREWVEQAFTHSIESKSKYDIDHRLMMKDGRVKYVNERCETTYNKFGKPVASIGVVLDITEDKVIHNKLEQKVKELSQARKAALNMMQDVESARQTAEHASQAKSEFLANMSHEIRTPLNAVTGMSYLLKQTQLTDKQSNYIATIHRSMTHVTGIINDLLDFSKIEAGKLELETVPFDLDKVLDSVTDFVMQEAEGKGVELLYDIPLGIPRAVIGDSTRLGQILINLVSNAIKFCDQGEVIVSIAVEQIHPDSVCLVFSIKDTGIGMDEAQLSNLFEAFKQADSSTTRRFGGTGLGLTICKYLVEAMQGSIKVQSRFGEGSEFSFSIRLGLQAQEKYKSFSIPSDLRHLNVLIVDDNSTSREVLGSILKELDFDYATVNSGLDAINLLEQTANKKQFDLILLDWMMPEMNGIETATVITQKLKLPHSPLIIMVSAYEKDKVMSQASEAGLHGYLHKPVNASILYDCIMQTIGKKLPKAHWRKNINEQTGTTRIDAAGRRILIVEDQPINRQIATEILIRNGFVVEAVENGKQAVDLIKQDISAFDVVLMDIQMPVMDGHEATKMIRKMVDKETLPIIAMTAHALEEERQKCKNIGMNAHVSKPVDVALLLAELSKCLNIPTVATDDASEGDRLEWPEKVAGIDLKEGLQRVMGNRKLYCKLLTGFPAQYQKVIDGLQHEIRNKQYDAAAKLTHTLAGSAGNLSMMPLRLACKKMQQFLELNKSDEDALQQVKLQFSVVVESIENISLPTDMPLGGHTSEYTEEKIGISIQELAELLANNDLRAGALFEQIMARSNDEIDVKALNSVGEQIARLDYAKALSILQECSVFLENDEDDA